MFDFEPLIFYRLFVTAHPDVTINHNNSRFNFAHIIRPFIIGGVALVIVALIGIITLVFTNNSQENLLPVAEVQYNKFANYLLYGHSSTKKITGQFISSDSYELDKQFYSNNTEFLNNSSGLLDDAIRAYTENSGNNEILSGMQVLRDNLELLIIYSNATEPTEDSVASVFFQSGATVAYDYVRNSYVQFQQLESFSAQAYASQRIEQYLAMIDLLRIYYNAGCTHGDKIDTDCSIDEVDAESIPNLVKLINDNERTAPAIIARLVKATEDKCWEIATNIQSTVYNTEQKK